MKKDKVVDTYHRIVHPLTFPTDHHHGGSSHHHHHMGSPRRATSPRGGGGIPRGASPKSPKSKQPTTPHPPPPSGPALVLPHAVVSQYIQSIQTTIPFRLKRLESKTGVMSRIVQDHFTSWPSYTSPDDEEGRMLMGIGGGGDGRVIMLPHTRQLLRVYTMEKQHHQHQHIPINNSSINTSAVMATLSSPLLLSSSPNTHHHVPGNDTHNTSIQSTGGGSSTATTTSTSQQQRGGVPLSSSNPLNSSTLQRGGSHHNTSSSIYPPTQPQPPHTHTHTHSPSCPITYLPRNPVPPNTVAVMPLCEWRPPGPYLGLKGAANFDEIIFLKLLELILATQHKTTQTVE